MSMVDCITIFLSWSREEQLTCVAIYEAMNAVKLEKKDSEKVQIKRRRQVKVANSRKPWTDDDDLAILETIEEVGPGIKAWRKLSRSLQRSRKAIAVRYYHILSKNTKE